MKATGFTFRGFTVKCGHSNDKVYSTGGHSEDEEQDGDGSSEDVEDVLMLMVPAPAVDTPLLSLQQVLAIMQSCCCFKTCTLSAAQCDDQRTGCVAKALRLFPDVAELKLVGPWRDVDLPTAGQFESVEKVCLLENTLLSSRALQLLVSRMPNLERITLAHAFADNPNDEEVQDMKTGMDYASQEGNCLPPKGWACSTSQRSPLLEGGTVWFRKPPASDLLLDSYFNEICPPR